MGISRVAREIQTLRLLKGKLGTERPVVRCASSFSQFALGAIRWPFSLEDTGPAFNAPLPSDAFSQVANSRPRAGKLDTPNRPLFNVAHLQTSFSAGARPSGELPESGYRARRSYRGRRPSYCSRGTWGQGFRRFPLWLGPDGPYHRYPGGIRRRHTRGHSLDTASISPPSRTS